MRRWPGEVPKPCTPSEGYRELVSRWLHTFGPGTESDLASGLELPGARCVQR